MDTLDHKKNNFLPPKDESTAEAESIREQVLILQRDGDAEIKKTDLADILSYAKSKYPERFKKDK